MSEPRTEAGKALLEHLDILRALSTPDPSPVADPDPVWSDIYGPDSPDPNPSTDAVAEGKE